MAELRDWSEMGVQSVPLEPDERHKPAITRLDMVDVTWAHWGVTPSVSEAQRSWSRHESLLTSLLGRRSPDPSHATELDSPMAKPGAFISLDPRVSEINERVDSLRDRASFDPLLLRPLKWLEDKKTEKKNGEEGAVPFRQFVDADRADKAVRFIVDGLKQCELTANRAKLRKEPGLLAAQMNLFACQIYLTPERAAELIHGPTSKYVAPSAPGHAMIDLRFREHLGRYWLYATFSVSTHQPSITLDSPNSVDGDVPPLVDRLEVLRDRYADAIRRGFQDHVYAFFPTAQMTILDRKYQPPRFWVAMGRDLTVTGAASENGHAVGQPELLNKLLSVPHLNTTGLGAGDIDGRARVFRRFIPSPRWAHDRPIYLVLPFWPSATEEDNHLRS